MARIYCSEQNQHEPLPGTADPVDVWLLLEHRSAWPARAVEEGNLDPSARQWLEQGMAALAACGLKVRPQLVRQPGIDSDDVRLFVGVPGTLLCFSGRDYGFLASVDLERVVTEPARFAAVQQPQYFVCTNGQRDVCCARFGLPIYQKLQQHLGPRAWQITHLGGHRFAPNVLALPQGALYGRVAVDDLDHLVAAVESGQLDFPRLRGRAWYPAPVQAAEALSGRSDLRFEAIEGDEAASSVRFVSADGPLTVRVRRADEPLAVQKSCGDGETRPVVPYRAG